MVQRGDIYGRGLKFPPQIGANGQMLWSDGEDNVRESLAIILRTQPGERLMLPNFGCDLEQFLFDPNTLATLAIIQQEVQRALTRWEPRVNIDDVVVESRLWNARTLIDITVFYTLIATHTQQTISTTFALQG